MGTNELPSKPLFLNYVAQEITCDLMFSHIPVKYGAIQKMYEALKARDLEPAHNTLALPPSERRHNYRK